MSFSSPVSYVDLVGLFAILWLLALALSSFQRRTRTTPLKGPKSSSFLYGHSRQMDRAEDLGKLFQRWVEEYGNVFQIRSPLGSKAIILCDPKAVAHFYSKDTFGYQGTPLRKMLLQNLVGPGVIYSEGDSHRRQRSTLSPGFSNASIRKVTPVFFDSGYKVKAAWDSKLVSSPDGVVIEVQHWMNRVSMDSIGIAGFSHDFRALSGQESAVTQIFHSFEKDKASSLSNSVTLLSAAIPALTNLPTRRNIMIRNLKNGGSKIAKELLDNIRIEKEMGVNQEKSIIGLLIKAENAITGLQLSVEEVMSQMRLLLIAGYETTSISLTWALIELAKNPEKQRKLRDEMSRFVGTDPTWDELSHGLPYLDAFVNEVLRTHPPVELTLRQATEDDLVPLSTPIVTARGETVDRIAISKGTNVTIPIRQINRSTILWGPDAEKFIPERWLDNGAGITKERAHEISGYRNLLTFADGPRLCLGKAFALAEFKAVLSVLVRNYQFELPDGPDTKINFHQSLLKRPTATVEKGAHVPLRIRRVD